MKPITILMFTLLFWTSYGQSNTKVFKRTEYINGTVYKETYDTVSLRDKKIDIYFFNKHFHLPYHIPEMFVSPHYKNETVSIWRDSVAKRSYVRNWLNTYSYDKFGRIVNYTYSGCHICSNMPYNYVVIYNANGQIVEIKNTIAEKDSYRLYYDNQEEIKQFDYYSSRVLQVRITRVQ